MRKEDNGTSNIGSKEVREIDPHPFIRINFS